LQNVDYIIRGDYVLPMDEKLTVITNGAVVVTGNKIIEVGNFDDISKKYSSEKIIEGKNRVVLPGFINTHTHAAMVYFRGMADDLPLETWLENHIWPAEKKWLSPEFVYDATELACFEMIKAGVTTYSDMYFFEEFSAKAAKKFGMRAILGPGILDFPTAAAKTTDEYFNRAEKFIEEWRKDELIATCIAPHSIYTCSPDTLKRSKKLADKYSVPIHIHLAETKWEINETEKRFGMSPVEHIEKIGLLGGCVIAAHCVWLSEKDISIMAENSVGVAHCIESNLKLASGIAPVTAMIKSGVKVSIGTDGAASNNDLNVLSEISTAAKVHKAVSNDPTVIDAKTALLMGTKWGAEALGLGNITGSLEKGKAADIIRVNLEKPHLLPLYDIYSHIVYSAMASDVEMVFVNGRMLLDNRKLCSADENEIISKAKEWKSKII
jgi:5-methylthioadenosine/S-adenosylhomocysteine deaminase